MKGNVMIAYNVMTNEIKDCNHQLSALEKIHNQGALVAQGIKYLRPNVRGLSKKDLLRQTYELDGMCTMYEHVFGYGNESVKVARTMIYRVLNEVLK
jgi:hypothetical protein